MLRHSSQPCRPTGERATREDARPDGQGLRLVGVAAAALVVFAAVTIHQAHEPPQGTVVAPTTATAVPDRYPGSERIHAEIGEYATRIRDLVADLQPTPPGSIRYQPSATTNDPFAMRTEYVLVVVDEAGSRPAALRLPAMEWHDTEEYAHLPESRFTRVADQPLSTFSADVDTASYANVRRFLAAGRLPPADAVRIEEMLNYFRYDYAAPTGAHPFSVALEVHAAPWNPERRLVRIGLRGKDVALDRRPAANLVFLVDVSGSMNAPDKLPLVQQSLRLLVDQLRESDRVAIVVYAGSSGLVLPSTSGDRREQIVSAIDRLEAGGSTNGGAGIELAYRVAEAHFVPDGVNRVLLCTDGDFNVGVSSEGGLVRLIEEKRKTGVFLSVLGFGRGNYADARMQALADKGNGNAHYIDRLAEARKVLVEQAAGTLITIAKDVKIQVEFNPAKVAGYRLIGYENRRLEAQDFLDDTKDAGEIGAGHQMTALYEIVPAGGEVPAARVRPLKYGARTKSTRAKSDDLLTVSLCYQPPSGGTSRSFEASLFDPGRDREEPSADFHFSSAVAMFGMLLRDSEHKGGSSYDLAIELALAGGSEDAGGHRQDFLDLVRQAMRLGNRH